MSIYIEALYVLDTQITSKTYNSSREPMILRRKQRHQEVKPLVQGHMVNKWCSQDGNPGKQELFSTSS